MQHHASCDMSTVGLWHDACGIYICL